MKRPSERAFDIRSLFTKDLPTQDYDGEEQEMYDLVEGKRKKRRYDESHRIFTEYELNALKDMDMEMIRSDVKLPQTRETRIDSADAKEMPPDNREWKIHILRSLIEKDRQNTEARINLSRLLDSDEGKKVLLDQDTGDIRIWSEIVDRHYTSDMFEQALNVRNGDEEFYEKLFSKEMDEKALRVGIEKHPSSLKLRMALADAIRDPSEKQRFLYDSVVSTEDEGLLKVFVQSKPDPCSVFSLYTLLREKNTYFDELFLYFLDEQDKGPSVQMDKNVLIDDSKILSDLFGLGLSKTLQVLCKCKRMFELPVEILTNKEILRYIKTIHPSPMTLIPPHLHSFFTSITKHNLHNDTTFISCYGLVKQYVLTAEFINKFFVMNPKRYFVDLLKARECWRLFMRTGDAKLFTKADKILMCGSRYYGKEMKTFVLARSKMYYGAGDYHTAYSVIPKKMKTIKKYVILAQMNLQRALKELEKDLFEYKHYLLYAELLDKGGMSPDEVYKECMNKYPDNPKVGLAYLRYLKMKDLNRALELSDVLVKRFKCEERIWFERFVIFRKLKRTSLSVLYNSRKYLKSHMIESEIKYYENKELPEENPHANYYFYKRACIKECNRDGVCGNCLDMVRLYYRNMIMKHQDDGDNYLIYYCVVGGVRDELKEMVEFFDPQGGDYWVRVRKIQDIHRRFDEGAKLLNFDLLN